MKKITTVIKGIVFVLLIYVGVAYVSPYFEEELIGKNVITDLNDKIAFYVDADNYFQNMYNAVQNLDGICKTWESRDGKVKVLQQHVYKGCGLRDDYYDVRAVVVCDSPKTNYLKDSISVGHNGFFDANSEYQGIVRGKYTCKMCKHITITKEYVNTVSDGEVCIRNNPKTSELFFFCKKVNCELCDSATFLDYIVVELRFGIFTGLNEEVFVATSYGEDVFGENAYVFINELNQAEYFSEGIVRNVYVEDEKIAAKYNEIKNKMYMKYLFITISVIVVFCLLKNWRNRNSSIK